jgi:monoamine oxidase
LFDSQAPLWSRYSAIFDSRSQALSKVGQEWTSSVAAAIARDSVKDVLNQAEANDLIHAYATGFRNFWMADTDRLSALVAASQVIDGDPSQTAMYHIVDGNDRLVEELRRAARCGVKLRHIVRAVAADERGVRVSVEGPNGRIGIARADFVVMAVPAALLPSVRFTPVLPPAQQRAFELLETGPGTKALLRFSRPWWRKPGRPRAYGSNLAIGAVWDVGEAQSAALLTLLAGGRASAALTRMLDQGGAARVAQQLGWLGSPSEFPQVHAVSWERDPWARGAYAYFSQRFDPALRPLLARSAGRVLFAGCHTSREFQGYMNGAIESGHRVAEEITHVVRLLQ